MDWSDEVNRLLKESRKLAKRANQRLVRLERYSKQDMYKGILEYSYKNSQKDIANLNRMIGKTDKSGPLRFRESGARIKGLSDKEMTNYLRSELSSLKRFLNSASSTIGETMATTGSDIKHGIKFVYDQRTATINSRFGTNFTPEQLQRFFNSRKQSALEREYGSKNMFKIADTIKDMGKTKREMKEYLEKHITLKNYEIHESEYKDAKDMYDQLKPYLKETDDPILNAFIGQAVEEGFTAKLLGFII